MFDEKQYMKQYYKDRATRLKAAGLCYACMKPGRPGKIYCVACAEKNGERSRRWREANPERSKRWQGATPEYFKYWRESNPERVRESSRRWYASNTEKAKGVARRWKQSNPGKHRENVRRWSQKKRSTPAGKLEHIISKGVGRALNGKKAGRKWEEFVGYTAEEALKVLGPRPSPDHHLEHLIPRTEWGDSEEAIRECWQLWNLRWMHKEDHVAKTAIDYAIQHRKRVLGLGKIERAVNKG